MVRQERIERTFLVERFDDVERINVTITDDIADIIGDSNELRVTVAYELSEE